MFNALKFSLSRSHNNDKVKLMDIITSENIYQFVGCWHIFLKPIIDFDYDDG